MGPNDIYIARKLLSIRQSAVSRGLDFNLSFMSVKNLLSAKKCYYTGSSLNNVEGDPNQLTIDRVDNTKGYVIGNVVACSSYINQKKGSLTPEEILSIASKLEKRK